MIAPRSTSADLSFRAALDTDLRACARIWRESINDYTARLGQPPIPDELGPIMRLHAHLRSTDPERFWVAERDGRLVGFVSALVRTRLWFLSMLFVLPDAQARGLGRALLARVMPDRADGHVLATATDSAQPVSNALYSTYGIIPRMPLLSLTGHPTRASGIEPLPSGVAAVAFDDFAERAGGGEHGQANLMAAIDALDEDAAGVRHPQDHAYLAAEARRGFVYVGPAGEPVAYGYASEVGRVGPVAAQDEALVAPILGHLLGAVRPRGATAVWTPGDADRAVVALLRAGLRLEAFPILVGWTQPFADFRRYLPISPGLP